MCCIKCNVLLQLKPATVTETAALTAATEAVATEAAATEAAVTDSSAWWQHNKMWGRSGACFLLVVKASSSSNQLMMCAYLASLLPMLHISLCGMQFCAQLHSVMHVQLMHFAPGLALPYYSVFVMTARPEQMT